MIDFYNSFIQINIHPNLIKNYLHLPIILLAKRRIHIANLHTITIIHYLILPSKYWLINELLNDADSLMLQTTVITTLSVYYNLERYAII